MTWIMRCRYTLEILFYDSVVYVHISKYCTKEKPIAKTISKVEYKLVEKSFLLLNHLQVYNRLMNYCMMIVYYQIDLL